MRILDFSEGSLSSRVYAAYHLRTVVAEIAEGMDIIVDLGGNLATTSWVDGFLVPIARRAGPNPGLAIVATSPLTRKHLLRVFSSRGVHARVATTRDAALHGEFERIPAA